MSRAVGEKIVAVGLQPRPGIADYRITVHDHGIACDDPFHTTGEGGTEPADVGGGWQLVHCAREGCDGAARVHAALAATGREP